MLIGTPGPLELCYSATGYIRPKAAAARKM